jgi:3-hydroxyisobutyrate dehydrogenase-like beta-hydroxyacid dehydrogenase
MACSIGFIGLGIMGAPMARRLLVAGHRLTLSDLTEGDRYSPSESAVGSRKT